jgi:15-cis-phytoene synthase
VRDLDLALSYVPRPQRLLLTDLFALDAALGQVVRTTTEPMLGRIRLAWWRERLEELDQGLVPAEPTLEAAARLVNETGLTGAMLAGLVEGWEPLLSEFPWTEEVAGPVAARGALLFGFAALLLKAAPLGVKMSQSAGALWALVDVAKHCSDENSRSVLIDVAKTLLDQLSGGPVEPAVRPLTMPGLLARRDLERWPVLEPEATPARAWMMIGHRLTGRL